MKIHFYKYQATGNDFVIIDNRNGLYSFSTEQVKAICDRKFGVGADGLMLIEKHPTLDFNLVYYNSDGSQSLCGNGSRAAVLMAASLGMVRNKTRFNAYDGEHEAELMKDGSVRLKMNNVSEIRMLGSDIFINTGSPHVIRFTEGVRDFPVYTEGKKIRYHADFNPGGTNVNFVEVKPDNSLFVRTYERGVENETLSCGTGVTAAAIAASYKGISSPVNILTPGGELKVEFKPASRNGTSNGSHTQDQPKTGQQATTPRQAGMFTDVFLIGPAKMVFEGDLEL